MRILNLFKSVLVICLLISVGLFSFACVQNNADISDSGEKNPEVTEPDKTFGSHESFVPAISESVPSTHELSPETGGALPTPSVSDPKDETNTEIAESFFDGEWESSSGMIYIFDGINGTLILKEKATDEILLEGTYETFSEDFSEFRLSMTFHGETDSFIAWKYSDSGMVRLIIEETGKTYDMLRRIDS